MSIDPPETPSPLTPIRIAGIECPVIGDCQVVGLMHRWFVAMKYERAGDSIDSPNLVLDIIGNQQIPLTIEDDAVACSLVWQAGPSDSIAPTIYFADRLLFSEVHRIDIALSIA